MNANRPFSDYPVEADDPAVRDLGRRPVLPASVRKFYVCTLPLMMAMSVLAIGSCSLFLLFWPFFIFFSVPYALYLLFAVPFSFSLSEAIAQESWTRRWAAFLCGGVAITAVHLPGVAAIWAILYLYFGF